MLLSKRKAQREAVQRIFELKEKKKRSEMLDIIVKKMFEVLESALKKISQIQMESADPKLLQLDKETMSGWEIFFVEDFLF